MKKAINIVYLIINAIPWALRIIIGGLMAVGTLLLSLAGVVFSVWLIVESIIEGSQGMEYWGLALVAGIIFLIFAVGFFGFAIAFIAVFAGILIIYVTSYIVSEGCTLDYRTHQLMKPNCFCGRLMPHHLFCGS